MKRQIRTVDDIKKYFPDYPYLSYSPAYTKKTVEWLEKHITKYICKIYLLDKKDAIIRYTTPYELFTGSGYDTQKYNILAENENCYLLLD